MRNAMKLAGAIIALAMIVAAPVKATPATCGGHGDKNTMLVSTDWLAEHLKDPNLVMLAVGQKSEYDAGHIPGSQFIEYMDTHLMKGPTGLSVELPPMSDLAKLFGKLGVTNDSRIVLYQTKDWFSPMTRIYLTLDAMGLGRQTSVLDGGYTVWAKEGRAVTTEVRSVTPGTITTCEQNDVIAYLDDVKASVHQNGVEIVDARDAEFYSGQTEPTNQRRGHIPGALSIPFRSLTDSSGKVKSYAELAEIFRAAGVKPGDRIIAYCHIGQQATAVYFAGRYLGYNVKLFDGSWEEWSKHTELPTETSH
ncbi:MAG TPA: sulfurtransferase [Candidatus Acidoferrum sp.]|nr:sulfurtransferase [Candidatus Acidoferrum sp.]